jgi:hypothetical protein
VIAVDTNILVYAHRGDSAFHEAAVEVVRDLAEGSRSWAVPWPCLHEFLAIVTHPRIYDPPTPVDRALTQVEAWLDAPTLVLLAESPDHWPQLRSLVAAGATGARVHDARIAALCAGSGVTELWTADRDFSRFPVRTVNPLLA